MNERITDLPEEDRAEAPSRRHLVVGLGASAGGIQALREFLGALPVRSGVAFVLVQHAAPGEEELLLTALRPLCPLPVEAASTGALPLPDRLHVVPPGSVLRLRDGRFVLRPARGPVERRTATDRLFRSLADDAGPCAVGIVLSGSGSDGALGLEAIGAAGGLAMAQAPDTAQQGEMPGSAVALGICDHVLPPADLARAVLSHAAHLHALPGGPDAVARHREVHAALRQVCSILKQVTGHDFRHYKTTTLARRLERRMQVLQIADVSDYLERLASDEGETRTLFRELLIGVTSFFRDPESFEALGSKVLRPLLAGRSASDELRIWVPGCATGEEAYSIAILAREAMEGLPHPPRVQIFATDIDERALATARRGSYPQGIATRLSPERLERFFHRKGRRFQVAPELREMCLFTAHNLVSDPPFSRLDLVSCRNLLIYLGPPLQKKLFPVFHYALKPGGYLFLGSSESLAGHGELFRPVDARSRIAQRKDTRGAVPGGLRDFGGQGLPGFRGPDQMAEPDLGAIAQRILLTEFAPRYAIVSEDGQVAHLSEGADRYLQPPVGSFSGTVTRMARRGLSAGLRSAFAEAVRRRRTVVHELPAVQTSEGLARVRLTVQPMPDLGHVDGLFMLVFESLGEVQRATGEAADSRPDAESVIDTLERELARAREELERAIQDQEAANEELKSSNEELLSMNEELQSANEELEASKEEVQAANRSLEQANADLENLLRSTQIATVFLDRQGRIRGFTPAAGDIYNVRAADLGRPLDELRSRLRGLPDVPAFAAIAGATEAEEAVAAHADGRWFLRRVLPYRGGEGTADGVLVTFVDITSQKRAEEEQRRATRLLAAVGDTTPDLLYVKDRRSRMLYANPSTLRAIGKPASEVLGRDESEWHANPAEVAAVLALDEAVMASGETRVQDEVFTSPDGVTRIYRSSKSPMRDETGAVVGLVGVTTDMTHARRAEEALRAAMEFNRRILDSSDDCIKVLSLDAHLEMVSSGGMRVMEVDDFAPIRGIHWPGNWEGDTKAVAAQAAATAAQGGTGRFRGYASTLKGNRKFWDVMVTPILGPDGQPEKLLAISRDITEQHLAEERLEEAATVLERMGEGFLVLDPAFRIKAINDEGLRIDGRPRDAILGLHLLEAWPEAEAFPTWPLYQRVAKDRVPGELVYHHLSETHDLWLEARAYPVGDDIAVFYRDVSDREQAREEAEGAARLLKGIVEAVPGLVYAKDRSGRLLLANRAVQTLVGLPSDAMVGRTDAEYLASADDARAIMENDRRVMDSGAAEQVEEEIDAPDGRRTVWLSSKAPLRDDGGTVVGLVGSSVDITTRRLMEEALRASEAQFRTIANAMPQMLWSTLPDGHHDFYNDRWYSFTGVPYGSTDGDGWAGMFHPDDRPAAWDRWRRSLATGEPYEVEYRLRHHSGDWRWVLGRALPVRDEAGAIVRWMGTCTEIEDRKRMEAALAEAVATKEVLLQEVNHRVKNSLQLVSALLQLQATRSKEPALREALGEAQARLSVVASLHQRLYATSQHDRVDFGDYLQDMATETLRSVDASGRVRLTVEAAPGIVLPLTEAAPLALVVSELVTNAVKYAFAGRDHGTLLLRLDRTATGARIEVADDGCGLPEGFDPRASGGLGMRIVTSLVRQVGGTLALSSAAPGTRAVIEIPVAD